MPKLDKISKRLASYTLINDFVIDNKLDRPRTKPNLNKFISYPRSILFRINSSSPSQM